MISQTADHRDDATLVRQVVEDGRYLVLTTADVDGRSWPSPVWYARDGREFIWVSRPETRHSSNLATRATVSFVIFEPPATVEDRPRAVYAEAMAAEVAEADLDRCLDVFNRRSRAQGLGSWTTDRVIEPADMRLYRAVVSRIFVLHPDRDVRREVEIDL